MKEGKGNKRETLGKMFSFLLVNSQLLGGRAEHPSGRASLGQSPAKPGGRWFSTMARARRVPSGAGRLLSCGNPPRKHPLGLFRKVHTARLFRNRRERLRRVCGPGLHFSCWGGGVSF